MHGYAEIRHVRYAPRSSWSSNRLLTKAVTTHSIEKLVEWSIHIRRTVGKGGRQVHATDGSTAQTQALGWRGCADAIRAIIGEISIASGIGQRSRGIDQTGCWGIDGARVLIRSVDREPEFHRARNSRGRRGQQRLGERG